uniref:DUF3078 domain-containing protein n=1 Tax=Eiseniibacteriota bacterium TaxID=2212470 RepID=A0A832MMY6_UNCEI
MRRIPSAVLAAALLAAALPARAEEKKPAEPGPWQFKSTAQLQLSQSAYSTNWAGGDRGSIVWVLGALSSAERQFTARFHLSNTLGLAYGQTSRQQPDPSNPGELVWDAPDKTTDQILFESIGRWTLGGYVDPYAALRLDTQFSDQTFPNGDLPLNPVKVKESAGIARQWVKTDRQELLSRLGFGFRQTFARSFVEAPPSERTESFTANDGGVEFQSKATWPLLGGRVIYKGDLLVFQPVFFSKSDALERFDALVRAGDASRPAEPGAEAVADFWKATDVNLQNTFSAEISRSISVNLFAQLVYDKFDAAANVDPALELAKLVPEVRKNVRKAGQFKQTLAIGISYRLF